MMDRAVWLCAGFVALPVESSQGCGTFQLKVAFAEVFGLDDEMKTKHGCFQTIDVFNDWIDLQMVPISLDTRRMCNDIYSYLTMLSHVTEDRAQFTRSYASQNCYGSFSAWREIRRILRENENIEILYRFSVDVPGEIGGGR